jgi:hypothetical protein
MDYRWEAGLWVGLSLSLYGLGVNYLAPLWAARKPQRPWAEGLEEAALGIYFLGIPAFALLRGAILPRFMGFTHLDWLGGIGPSVQAALFFALLFSAVMLLCRRARSEVGVNHSALLGFKQAIYFQTHWALYRAFAIPLLGLASGTLAGLVLAISELFLSLRERPDPSTIFRLGGLAVATGVIFLYSRNFLYCLAFHWLLQELMARIKR